MPLQIIKEPEKATINSLKTHKTKQWRKHGKLTSYCATFNQLLKTYVKYEIIDTAENDIVRFLQPDRIPQADYYEELYRKSLL